MAISINRTKSLFKFSNASINHVRRLFRLPSSAQGSCKGLGVMSAVICASILFADSLAHSATAPGGSNTSSQLLAQRCVNIEIRTSGSNRMFGAGTIARTCNGYRLVLQSDGNLVLYSPSNHALWATGTDGQKNNRFVVQADGNMVLYSSASQPLWASNTDRNAGAFLAMQTDGNLVAYRRDGHALWASNTNGGRQGVRNAAQIWSRSISPQPSSAPAQATAGLVQATPEHLQALLRGDYNNRQLGPSCQCVSMVQHVTGIGTTGTWRRGTLVMSSNIPRGTAIATFNNSRQYDNRHAAIFDRFGTHNGVRGFWAWSTNWASGNVGDCGRPGVGLRSHFIPVGGQSVNNADIYYTISR
jgi:hypothetical protein